MTSNLHDQLKVALEQLPEERLSQPLVVAVSGGVDSMVLLSALQHGFGARYVVKAAHVNYGLRGLESEADQNLVMRYCQSLGVELLSQRAPVLESHSGVQAWARQVRYLWFAERFAKQVVLLAHQYEDLLETVLFRLLRGGSAGALLGMQVWQAPYLRPFLNTSKAELRAYASRHDVPFREDSSNAKLVYSRNKIRHLIMPELQDIHPQAHHHLIQHAHDSAALIKWAQSSLRQDLADFGSGIPRQWLQSMPAALAYEALKIYITRFCAYSWISRRQVEMLQEDLALNREVRNYELAGGTKVLCLEGDRVWLRERFGTKAKRRYDQHRLSTGYEVWRGEVAPHSKVCMVMGDTVLELWSKSCHGLSVMVETIPSYKSIIFGVEDKRWSLGELIRLWNICTKKHEAFKLFTINNQDIAFFDGEQLMKPSAHGERIILDDWLLSVQTYNRL